MKDVQVNRYLDHAILKPEMTLAEVREAIELGVRYAVKTVCVRPCDIALALELCAGTETEVCVTLAFPHGLVPSVIKAEEAKLYIAQGVHEVDMVVNYSYIRSGEWDLVAQDIAAVANVTRPAGILLKVIFETAMLTTDEVARTTELAVEAGADYVKTSTGFNGGGATEEAVRTMLDAARGRIKVKASGGIRDAERALMFIDMGCERIGVGYTSTVPICEGAKPAAEGTGY